jgi:glycerol-3-phosphate dehydrogenase
MTPSRARRKFPQLANNLIKYCSVFYEGIHDDARTNLAIAMTAAREGAVIANYCEAIRFLHAKDDPNPDLSLPNRVVGAVVRDRVTDTDFVVRAKSVLFCGGPFTDELRQLEDPNAVRAVTGASGIHIVLPGYFAPASIGLVDMSTSDGRFLFFLPWNGHVLVGTTDHQCEPTMRPVPDESVRVSHCLVAFISHSVSGDPVAAERGLQVHISGAAAAQTGRAECVGWHSSAGQGPAGAEHGRRQS